MTMKALGLAEKIPEGGGSRAIPHIIEAAALADLQSNS